MSIEHDPLCKSDAVWSSKTKPCPICALYREARADERARCIDIVSGAYVENWGACGWNRAVSMALAYLRGAS